ncbi:ChaB family protein [Chitinimonas sp. BJB300]|uniref:ChaB family protein n=1 Tax=Chitinimonas sp. BJB300 TaxID=1559339 RepID=UPI000C0CEA7F|nr:ChaB family protein [Chitinimonas sp. BJB300]PHV09798.1 cation transport regulator [Chitinimonas sp. BJB300]TSJ90164.1 cation transport regulator [Chitinimonas sp. BJB300]
MVYRDRADLPNSVQRVLPDHAQAIYLEAFNHAWDQYKEKKDRRGGVSRKETAHKVAWSAVKRGYKKDEASGKWWQKTERSKRESEQE